MSYVVEFANRTANAAPKAPQESYGIQTSVPK
jgi:hypothetical protein